MWMWMVMNGWTNWQPEPKPKHKNKQDTTAHHTEPKRNPFLNIKNSYLCNFEKLLLSTSLRTASFQNDYRLLDGLDLNNCWQLLCTIIWIFKSSKHFPNNNLISYFFLASGEWESFDRTKGAGTHEPCKGALIAGALLFSWCV